MPTYLRRFYLQKLTETKENEIKQAENTRKNVSDNISRANISPQKSKPVSRFKR